MKKKNQFSKIITTRMDKATGELYDHTRVVKYSVDTDDNFVKLYSGNLAILKNLSKTASQIIPHLASKINYDNEVLIGKKLRESYANELGISIFSIDKAISELVKSSILFRVEKGKYLVNPYLFGKGTAEKNTQIRENLKWKPFEETNEGKNEHSANTNEPRPEQRTTTRNDG